MDPEQQLANLHKLLEIADKSNIEDFQKLSSELDNIDYTDSDNKIKINFVNKSDNPDPIYNHEGDSGFDLAAFIDSPIILGRFERILIPTGLYFDIPKGYELQIRPRSGNSLKYGLTVLNSPATVDQNYTGEIKIILINLGSESFIINKGMRIAQGVFCGVLNNYYMDFNKVDDIVNTESTRQDKGFGSTNI